MDIRESLVDRHELGSHTADVFQLNIFGGIGDHAVRVYNSDGFEVVTQHCNGRKAADKFAVRALEILEKPLNGGY